MKNTIKTLFTRLLHRTTQAAPVSNPSPAPSPAVEWTHEDDLRAMRTDIARAMILDMDGDDIYDIDDYAAVVIAVHGYDTGLPRNPRGWHAYATMIDACRALLPADVVADIDPRAPWGHYSAREALWTACRRGEIEAFFCNYDNHVYARTL